MILFFSRGTITFEPLQHFLLRQKYFPHFLQCFALLMLLHRKELNPIQIFLRSGEYQMYDGVYMSHSFRQMHFKYSQKNICFYI